MQSETQMQLSALASRRETYEKLEVLLENLEKLNALHAGIHDHNMVFDQSKFVPSKPIISLSKKIKLWSKKQ